MKKAALTILILCGLNLAPSPAPAEAEFRKLKIVASTHLIADLVRAVGGLRVTVTALIEPGESIHDYRLTPVEKDKIREADLVFFHGLGLEGRMLIEAGTLARTNRVYYVADVLPKQYVLRFRDDSGRYHPLIWHDPKLYRQMILFVRSALVKMEPMSKGDFYVNSGELIGKVKDLERYIRTRLSEIETNKVMIATRRDSLLYFGRKWGIATVSMMPDLSMEDPSMEDMMLFAEYLKKRRIPVIFGDEVFSPEQMRLLQKAADAVGWEVKLHGTLYSTQLGEHGTETGNYFGMYLHNVDTIVDGFQLHAPEVVREN